MSSSLSSPLSGAGLLSAVGLFSQILGFLYRIALSRLVGAEMMGLYQLIMPVYSVLMAVTAVGLTVAVSTLSARAYALNDWLAVRRALRKGITLFLGLTVPLGACLILASDPVSVYILGDARTQLGLILLVPCVLLTGIENLHKHCFYGIGNVRPPAASETIEQIVRVAVVLGLLLALLPQNPERTVGIIVLGMIVCEVFSVATLVLLFRRQNSRMDSRQSHVNITYRQLISIAAPVALTALLGNIMGSANSVLIPQELVRGGMTASESISAFGVLCGMTMAMLNLPTGLIGALGLTMVPGLARQAALGQWGAIRTTLGRVIRLVSLLMAPALALLTVIGPDIGKVLFANPDVGEFMFPLAVGTLLSCWQSVLSGALNGIGHQRSAAVNAIICDAVQLAFTVLTVSHWGLAGFVTGFVVSSALGAALNLRSMCRFAKLRPAWFQWFLCPALAAVLAGLCSNLLFRWLSQNGASRWVGCLAVCGVGGIVYLAALQAQGVLGGGGGEPS